jgi:chemotaxis protein histidine kinase CheA
LCIAKELTERMGGQITVESQLGKGSRFTLHFPLGTSLLYREGNQPAMQLNGAR